MNEQRSNPEARFEDILLAHAWQEVESNFRAAGEVAPLPGFTARWMARLEMERQREERLQASALIIGNLVIALGFLILVGLQFVPSVSSGSLLDLWVDLLSRAVLTIKMISGVLKTLMRTIPRLVPTSWLVSGITLVGMVVTLWVSMARRHMGKQGVIHAEN